MQARRGEKPEVLEVYDTEARILINDEITKRAIDFMERQVAASKPFFLYVPYTQPHMPTLPHPDFKGVTGAGDFADVLHQIDVYVGRLEETVDRLGIEDNTIFIFTSDNGPDPTFPHTSFAGPWSGSYFTGKEGSLRVPFIIRWPGRVPEATRNNEIVHQLDIYPTLARIVGADVPQDRVIDGVDQLDFFTGEIEQSNREHVIIYVGNDLYGIKWRHFKVMSREIDDGFRDPKASFGIPQFYDLRTDPKEENAFGANWYNTSWTRWPAGQFLVEHLE